MYLKYGLELERPYPTRLYRNEEAYKPEGEVADCKEGVRGVYSTDDFADSKTVNREGTLSCPFSVIGNDE
ncbi:MAG: hypothetical protein N2645_03780 [Clostridia bacterium]|nr:hypothetical protein [Clostridia bacterium]